MIVLARDRYAKEATLLVILLALFVFMPVFQLRVVVLALFALRFASALYSMAVPRFVTVSRDGATIYANTHERFEVTMVVRNLSFLPIYFMTVQDTVSAGVFAEQDATFVVSLRAFERRTLSYGAVVRERGVYEAGPVRVEGHDPLRTYGFRRRIAAPVPLVVYPSVHRVDLPQRVGLPSGSIQVANRLFEDMTRYSAVREYQPGDEMKRINWKASARMGKLFSMEYQPSIYFPVLLVVNLSESSYPTRGREALVNRITEVAASLVFYIVRLKQEIGLVTTGCIPGLDERPTVPIRAGYGNAVAILETLARVEIDPESPNVGEHLLRAGVSIPNGTRIFVVSPPLREREAVALMARRRRGFRVELFEVRSRHMNRKDEFTHDLPTHEIAERGGELVHG